MLSANTLLEKLQSDFPKYQFKSKKQFGWEAIIVRETFRKGAKIIFTPDKIQILPSAPTTRGAMLMGHNLTLAKIAMKSFDEPAKVIFKYLNDHFPEEEIEFISGFSEIAPSEKDKKMDAIVLVILGTLLIPFSVWLYAELAFLEAEGGSRSIPFVFELAFDFLGKEVACGLLGFIGLYMFGAGFKNIRKIYA